MRWLEEIKRKKNMNKKIAAIILVALVGVAGCQKETVCQDKEEPTIGCPDLQGGCNNVFETDQYGNEIMIRLNQDQSIGYRKAERDFYQCFLEYETVSGIRYCQFGEKGRP